MEQAREAAAAGAAAEGFAAAGAPASFVELTGVSNPFSGIVDTAKAPAMLDVDGDGDLDLVLGNMDGDLRYFRNQAGSYVEQTGAAANPFALLGITGAAAPTPIDIDGDGDLDLLVGTQAGSLRVVRNDGGSWSSLGPIAGINTGGYATPVALDLDGDGHQDIVSGNFDGKINYFHSNGDGTFTEQTGAANPFDGIELEDFSAIGFIDVDGDGDLDAVISSYDGVMAVYTDDGNRTFVASATNPFASFGLAAEVPSFAFVDLDSDGDLDAVAGTFSPADTIRVFQQTGSPTGLIAGTPGNNGLSGTAGDDTIDGRGGVDVVTGGLGNDSYYVDSALDQVVEGVAQGAADRIYASVNYTLGAGVHVETLSTNNDAEHGAIGLTGNELANGLRGNAGANVLDGKAGADTMTGLGGDDSYYVDNAGDAVVEGAAEGTADRVYASASYTLGAGVYVEALSTDNDAGTGAINLTGNELVNTLQGNAGNNVLDGKAGADTMVGGTGDDHYYVDNAGDQVVEDVAEGNDRIFASFSYVLDAGKQVETLSTSNDAGTGAINLTGNELVNTIYGNAGANVLDGRAGADTLVGLGGDDWYHVDNALDGVTEGAADGANDRVFASTSWTLTAGAYVERLTTNNNNATTAINLTGNAFGNLVYGNAGANVLDGKAGNDALSGLAGNDTLIGGLGNDTMAGGAGDDWYYVDSTSDVVVEVAGEGTGDRILTSVSFTLGAGIEVERLTTDNNAGTAAINLNGSAVGNLIYGNAGANILDGRGGADTLVGFGGNDSYYVDNALDSVTEAAGEGADRIYASVSYTQGAGVHVETLTTTNNAGTAAINLTGNELANAIYGNAGANVLDGKGGVDALIGLAGADTFAFTTALGAGNIDTVSGFVVADDTVMLENAVFTGLAAGALAAGAFNTGTAATQADDRIIYNSATGALLFDADGSGAGAAVQFATLAGGLALTSADFLVT